MLMKIQEATAPKKVLALITAAMLGLGSSATAGFAATNGKRTTPIFRHRQLNPGCIFNENVSFDHYFGTYPSLPILPENRISKAALALRP